MPNTPSPNQAEHLCLRLQLLLDLATVLNALQNVLAVLIDLQFGDNNLRGVNADGDGLARGFVLGDSFDVDDVFETVYRSDLSFAALIGSSDNEDFVVFADGDRSDIVLLTELFAQRRTHDSTSNAGRGIVMSLARLSPRGVQGRVNFGHDGD